MKKLSVISLVILSNTITWYISSSMDDKSKTNKIDSDKTAEIKKEQKDLKFQKKPMFEKGASDLLFNLDHEQNKHLRAWYENIEYQVEQEVEVELEPFFAGFGAFVDDLGERKEKIANKKLSIRLASEYINGFAERSTEDNLKIRKLINARLDRHLEDKEISTFDYFKTINNFLKKESFSSGSYITAAQKQKSEFIEKFPQYRDYFVSSSTRKELFLPTPAYFSKNKGE